jgi:hypothetical protein
MLVAGLMRDVNTANWAPNTQLYLSTTAGEYTNPRPEAPDHVRGIGVVVIQHATEGSILVSLDPIYDLEWGSNIFNTVPFETDQFYGWQPTGNRFELLRSQRNFFNGTTRESFDAVISAPDSGNIVLSLEQAGGGDLTMQFTDGDTILDCTPAQTINITPGTDTSPAGTMVYIPYSTKTLTSGSTWPSEEHIKICYMAVPSSQFVYDHGGPYVNQNWNDHLSDTEGIVGQGHLSHVAAKIRLALGASWYSGINPDGQDDAYFTFPAASTIYWESTEGVIAQLHPQTFGAKDTGNGNIILVANDFIAPYTHVSNLFDIDTDSTGNTIGNNRYFSLIFWGVQNKSDQGSGVVVNLPAGNYTGESQALVDSLNYDDYNFPREFTLDSGTAFLICRSTFQMGTTGWTHIQTEDLRGKVPSNQVGGGGGGGVTDHGSLGGLADDDHTQYALVTGNRAFTGNVTLPSLNMSGHIINYAGSPSDGQVLGWVTANSRFEAVTNPAGVTDHGALTGLADDDHTQYILADGTREFTGNVTVNAALTVTGNADVTGNVNVTEDVNVTGDVLCETLTVNAATTLLGDTNVSGELTVDYQPVTRTLVADLTFYVRTTGNDSNNGLTANSAFATVQKAITESYKYHTDGYTLTVNVGAGHYTSNTLEMSHHNSDLNIVGEYDETINASVDAVSSIGSGPTGFEYIDITSTFTGSFDVTVGDYVIVKSASGGSNPVWTLGCHEITSWNSGNREAIFRVWRADTTVPVPNTSVVLDEITLLNTKITFSGTNGIEVHSGGHGGRWDNIMLEGPGLVGVYLDYGATGIVMANCGFSEWVTSVGSYASVFSGADTWHSYAEAGIQAYAGSHVELNNGAVTGVSGYGLEAALNSGISFYSSDLIACGYTSYAAFCSRNGYINFTSARIRPGGGTTGLRFQFGGGGDLTSYSNTYSTSYSVTGTGYVN